MGNATAIASLLRAAGALRPPAPTR
jgi:hypothetical protein